jgi:hypothetical protein
LIHSKERCLACDRLGLLLFCFLFGTGLGLFGAAGQEESERTSHWKHELFHRQFHSSNRFRATSRGQGSDALQSETKSALWPRWAVAAALLVYSLAMSWDRIGFHFASDDMMNLGHYFQQGSRGALAAQLLLWKGFYRPLGAAFYLPLYHWFGLNPAPFQIAIFLILAINALVLFRLAIALGASDLAAGLAALVVAYHAGLTNLQYNTDMIYDVLCFSFLIGAMTFYASIRGQGRKLRWYQIAIFLLLYLCALNAKEMALTLPLLLVSYEWCYGESGKRSFTVAALAAVMAAVSLYGKKFGVEPLLGQPAYQPVFTLQRFMSFQKASLADLFGHTLNPGWRGVLVIRSIVTYLAWRRNRPLLRFSWIWMLVTPLPIMFLEGRVQGNLYVPLAGWAMFIAVIFLDLAHAVSAVLVKETLFQRLGRKGAFALLVVCGVLLWVNRMRYLTTAEVRPSAAKQGIVTAQVLAQLRELNPHVPPRSQVVFLNDPFTDWDMTFIGMLWFGDRSVHVYNQRTEHLSTGELARMDHVFDFVNGKLVQLR